MADDGKNVGESDSKLKDELARRRFNPKRVRSLWNYKGHSSCALVEFHKNWPGLYNAMSFGKAYDADHHGKKDWYANGDEKSGLYAWLARAEDYNLLSIVGEKLRKTGDLIAISEFAEEQERNKHVLVANLTNTIKELEKRVEEFEKRETRNECERKRHSEEMEKDHDYGSGGSRRRRSQ